MFIRLASRDQQCLHVRGHPGGNRVVEREVHAYFPNFKVSTTKLQL